MPLPDADVRAIDQYVAELNAPGDDELRFDVEYGPGMATLVERRAPWHASAGSEWARLPVARLRYTATSATWLLYVPADESYRRYDHLAGSPTVQPLIDELRRDPTGIFFG